MTDFEIRELDLFDEADLRASHATYAASEREGREETASPWSLDEYREHVRAEISFETRSVHAMVVDGEMVSMARLALPQLENRDLVEFELHTHPAHRRRGYGSRLLAAVEQTVKDAGRSSLITEVPFPYDAPQDGAGHAGPDFLTSHGFRFGLGDVMRRLELPVADDVLAALAAEAAPHHSAYTLRAFAGPVPDDLAQGFAEVTAALSADAPMGDLEYEPDVPNVRSMREAEAVMARQGRTKYNVVALDAEGGVVAYTELVTTAHQPGKVFQWGTLVRKEHRGHRLGLAVKVANLRFLQEQVPDARFLVTWNAEVNDHMVGINEQLGFRPVERLGEFQKRL